MELRGEFVLTGMEVKMGVKDPSKTYPTVLLSRNTESMACTCQQSIYDDIQAMDCMYKPVECLFDYNPKYENLKLSALVPA